MIVTTKVFPKLPSVKDLVKPRKAVFQNTIW